MFSLYYFKLNFVGTLVTKITNVLKHILRYPSPVNLDYSWSMGFVAGCCLAVQIISGLFLAMWYSPDITLAFSSVEYIIREVNFGYLFKYIHANGASLFMLILYLHIFRGLYFRSFATQKHVWISGMVFTC